MNTLFYFYPHCFINVTKNEFFVYNTHTFEKLHFNNIHFPTGDRNTLNKGYILHRNEIEDIISSCKDLNMGYDIEYDEVIPYMNNRKLKFITSLEKEYKYLNHNLPSYTNNLLNSITFLLNNSVNLNYSTHVYSQIGYPHLNEEPIDYKRYIEMLKSFPSLREVILAGEINEEDLIRFLKKASENAFNVIYRVFGSSISVERIHYLLDSYEDLYIELIINRNDSLDELKSKTHNRLFVKAIIQELNDIQLFSEFSNLSYIPIFQENKNNQDLLSEIVMNKNEILSIKKSLRELLYSSYININAFGRISIDFDGNVFCLNQRIGSLTSSDLPCLINQWIREEDCMWFYCRNKKELCQECALSSLCPAINIYEAQGIYRGACMI